MVALLVRLTDGQSKCPYESGTLKLRHILTYRRLMYHHEILSREDSEPIKKLDGVGPVDNRPSTE